MNRFGAASLMVWWSLGFGMSSSVLAQPQAPGDGTGIIHDGPENDPSRGPTLRLKKEIPQKRAALEKLFVRAGEALLPTMPSFRPTYAQLLQEHPEAWRFLRLHRDRYAPKKENGLTAVNADHEFEGISDVEFGICWGFATLHRNFSVLAFFDPASREGVPGNPNSEAWLDFYRGKIDQIAAGHATLIPGMRNLRELSMVPQLELYLKVHTLKLWADRAVHTSSIDILRRSTQWMDFNEVESMLKNLEARLARGEYPKILFSSLIAGATVMGANPDIHVVLVHRIERGPDHTAKIHLWDISFYAETQMRQPKFIQVTKEHGLTYAPWYEADKPYAKGSDLLSQVRLAPENDAETVSEILELKKFCSNPKHQAYCGTETRALVPAKSATGPAKTVAGPQRERR